MSYLAGVFLGRSERPGVFLVLGVFMGDTERAGGLGERDGVFFLAGVFLAGVFLAGVFLAGVFLAGAFLAGGFLAAAARPRFGCVRGDTGGDTALAFAAFFAGFFLATSVHSQSAAMKLNVAAHT